MKKFGITGNIGSGKSTVANIFYILGIPVYDADSRAKAVMVENQFLVQQIKSLLGEEAYFPDGSLNRVFISSKVFNQSELLTGLNALVHPAVFKDFDDWFLQQNAPYVLKEAALLVESNSYKTLDGLIVVAASEEIRLNRCMKRDHATRDAVLARMKNQISQEKKIELAQFVISNNNELLIPQVLEIHRKLLS